MKSISKTYFILSCLLFASITAHQLPSFAGQNQQPKANATINHSEFRNTDPSLAAKLDRLVAAYTKLGRFSGAVLVAQDGKEIFSTGAGLASIEYAVPNTPTTKFVIASLSKQFTAAAILKLESEGKLSVNDAISKHWPDYPKPQGDQVTIHHLLTHSSGIPSLYRRDGIPEITDGKCDPIAYKDLIALFKDRELQFTPGTKYRYSNSGYMVLAGLIEKISGMKYEDYLRQKLFEPAAMSDSGFDISGIKIVPQLARPYIGYAPDIVRVPPEHPTWSIGAGGIYTTVKDLLKWDHALSAGKILPPEQLKKYFEPHIATDSPKSFYSYGWFIQEMHGHKVIRHNGTVNGFIAEYYRFPEDHLFITVLSNRMPEFGINIPAQIGRNISALMLGAKFDAPPLPIELNQAALRRFVGDYEFAPGYVVKVELKGNQLMAKAIGDESWSLSTYGKQQQVDKSSPNVTKASAIIRAFASGDHQAVRDALVPRNKERFRPESVDKIKRMMDELGGLSRMNVYTVDKSPQEEDVFARLAFPQGERSMRIELSNKGELLGWGVDPTLPSEVPLVPVSPTAFFIDAFRAQEKDLNVEFVVEGGKVTGLVLKSGAGSNLAKRRL